MHDALPCKEAYDPPAQLVQAPPEEEVCPGGQGKQLAPLIESYPAGQFVHATEPGIEYM